jgi:ubiquinone biosynthesis protein
MALRGDLFSTEVCAVLSKIREADDGIPFDNVRQTLEEEIKTSLESLFEHFEETPFVATSVAQLHRAYLKREKVWVVVKVQKPYAKQIYLQDIAVIRRVIWFLKLFSVYSNMCWEDMCKQLEELVTKELDFRYEASSLRRLKKKLHPHEIYVPETFSKYSTPRVLVMEFLHATLMSDFIALKQNDPARIEVWLKDNHIEPRRVARCLFYSVYRQIFEDNLFHGDMHPGNIVLLRNNRLAIIDCRSVGTLEAELLTKYRLFLQAIANQQYSTAADLYFLQVASLPVVDIAKLKAELVRIWRTWETKTHIKELPFEEKSITYMFAQLSKVVFNYRFAIPWSLSKLARAWANLDASLLHLVPEMNSHKYLRRYFKHANRRVTQDEMQQIPQRIGRSLNTYQELPQQFSEYALFQQTILRRQAQVIQGKATKSGYVIAAMVGFVALGLLLLEGLFVFTFLHQCFDLEVQWIIGHQLATIVHSLPVLNCGLWFVVLLFVLYLFLAARRMKKYLEQMEVIIPNVPASI